jgi:hypothetical protein
MQVQKSQNLARTSQAQQSARDAASCDIRRTGASSRDCFAARRTEIERGFPIPRGITKTDDRYGQPTIKQQTYEDYYMKASNASHLSGVGREHPTVARRRPKVYRWSKQTRRNRLASFAPFLLGSVRRVALWVAEAYMGSNGEAEAVMVTSSCERVGKTFGKASRPRAAYTAQRGVRSSGILK